MSVRNFLWYGLLLVPLIFLCIFFFYPLASIFAYSLLDEGQLDISGFITLATRSLYIETLLRTTWQAILSTFFTIALALPSAYVFTRYRFRGKSLLLSLSTLPFVLPTVVVATAFMALIGPRGFLNEWLVSLFMLDEAPIQLRGTLEIIIIVHVFYNYAIALRMIASYWANQSAHIEEAAQVLGASGKDLWLKIRLPILQPAIFAAFILVFIFTFTSFGVVLILGDLQFMTLEVQIYYQAQNLFNLPLAAALSLVQIVTMLLMMTFYTRLQRNIATTNLQSSQNVERSVKNWREKLFLSINLGIMILLLFTPLLALIMRSFIRDGSFTVVYYQLLAQLDDGSVLAISPLDATINSLKVASITTIIATSLGLITAYLIAGRNRPKWVSQILDPVFMLPLATSAVTLGFGFTIALDDPPLDLRASWWIIPIAHTLIAIPFVIRSVLPAIRAIPDNLYEASAILGASPLKTWWFVEVPLISQGLIVGATFAFTVSMGEFGASLFVVRANSATMPLIIYRLLGQPGVDNYGQALAMSSLLMLVCAVSFVAIERIRQAGIGEF
ncbi:MAG: iron ABC transporter permease [Phototrophicaceae bacterium]